MKRAIGLSVVLAALAFAPRAQAQETHKFNAKALEAKYTLPVFAIHGRVLNDEVIETVDDVDHQSNAVYEVRTELKKALDFFTKQMGTPTQETSDTGNTRYVFKKQDPPASKVRHRVIVTFDKGDHQVRVTLWMREYESAADADN